MITLFRMIKLHQLKTKWTLAVWQLIDQKTMEFIKNPENLEKKFVDALAKLIHESNINNTEK